MRSRLPWPQRLQLPAASAAPWQVAWGRARFLSDLGENFVEVCAKRRRALWLLACLASVPQSGLFVAFLELGAVPGPEAAGTRLPHSNTQKGTPPTEAQIFDWFGHPCCGPHLPKKSFQVRGTSPDGCWGASATHNRISVAIREQSIESSRRVRCAILYPGLSRSACPLLFQASSSPSSASQP